MQRKKKEPIKNKSIPIINIQTYFRGNVLKKHQKMGEKKKKPIKNKNIITINKQPY
jgi:hypothetical protein